MSTGQPLVSVVVLNWRGTDDTLKCIDSLGRSSYKNVELVLVDNESSPESKKALEDVFFPAPKKVITHHNNLGFTGGQLSAYPYCNGDFILLLNNDAEIGEGAIQRAISTMLSDKRIAVVGGRSYILDDDWSHLGAHFYSHQRIDPITAEVTTYDKDDNVIVEVSNVSGACVLIRKDAIKQCGYFDNHYFAYYEETDLFSRFRRRGWKIMYDPEVFVWHKHGASTKDKKYMYYFFMLKNQYRYAFKNFDRASLKRFKDTYHRHLRRSLKIYLKNIGRLQKSDLIHKARVRSYVYNLIRLPELLYARKKTLRINKGFSINEQLFVDNPLPISILVDGTSISKTQEANLIHNLQYLASAALQPAEIVVISKKHIKLPQPSSLIRFVNIVDKNIFSMNPLDFFMMSSNYDVLLFGTSKLLDVKLSDTTSDHLPSQLRNIYTSMITEELAAVVTQDKEPHNFRRGEFLNESFNIAAIKKTFVVHYLVDNTHLTTLDSSVLTNVIGESLAQCRKVGALSLYSFFGLKNGVKNTKNYSIIQSALRWNIKRILISIHVLIFIKFGVALLTKPFNKPVSGNNTTMQREPLSYSKEIPVIINTRDRFDPLMQLISWLESVGHKRILFVDNDSSYPPLVKYFKNTPYQVVQLGRNGMHKAPWESFGVRFAAKDLPYILTDPDIIPAPICPSNAVEYFVDLLNRYPKVNKVGFGLEINNIPDTFALKEHVISWEKRFWDKSLQLEKDVYGADIDTTFALYRPYTWWFLGPSIRTGGKYIAKHEPWYQNSSSPTEDFLYYTARANNKVSTWSFGKLPKHHLRALRKEGFLPDYTDEEIDDVKEK